MDHKKATAKEHTACFPPAGAFFIPYPHLPLYPSISVFLLETALGQYTSQGGITAWRKICPIFEGESSCLTPESLHQVITAFGITGGSAAVLMEISPWVFMLNLPLVTQWA